MKNAHDAFGQHLLAQYHSRKKSAELIERDDNYIDFGSEPGLYFSEYRQWSPLEKKAIKLVRGRVLDVGCGAGRHALYLQEKGFDVTGIDTSPGAIKVCKLRGFQKALVRPIEEVDKFKPASFDTIIMLGNNFGLFGSCENAQTILQKLSRITTPAAQIIAGTRDPYQTDDPNHFDYHKFNRRRGRMAGQLKIRVRYKKTVGEWFDYLLVSPDEMEMVLQDTGWQIRQIIGPKEANYLAVITKKLL